MLCLHRTSCDHGACYVLSKQVKTPCIVQLPCANPAAYEFLCSQIARCFTQCVAGFHADESVICKFIACWFINVEVPTDLFACNNNIAYFEANDAALLRNRAVQTDFLDFQKLCYRHAEDDEIETDYEHILEQANFTWRQINTAVHVLREILDKKFALENIKNSD